MQMFSNNAARVLQVKCLLSITSTLESTEYCNFSPCCAHGSMTGHMQTSYHVVKLLLLATELAAMWHT